jgi:ABC-type phosphonate transport system ATPase subunit
MSSQAELESENESMSTVTLGDVAFDPVATQDFRLSVEGTSGTGKSNTLAVILSKLAEQNVVAKTTKQGKAEYSLNVDGMREIIHQQRKRTEMSKLKEQVKG